MVVSRRNDHPELTGGGTGTDRRQGAGADLDDAAGETSDRAGLERHARLLSHGQPEHVRLGDFHLGVDAAQVRDGHQRRARLVLDADDDHLAFAHLQARDDPVDGRRDVGLGQLITCTRFLRSGLAAPLLRRAAGADRPGDRRVRRLQLCARGVERRLRFIELRSRREALRGEHARALEGELSLLQTRLRPFTIRGGTGERVCGPLRIRFERLHPGAGRCRITPCGHGVDAREHLPRLHAIAFLHAELDDPAHGARTDVGVARRDDLARRGHERLELGAPRRGFGRHLHAAAPARHPPPRQESYNHRATDQPPSSSYHPWFVLPHRRPSPRPGCPRAPATAPPGAGASAPSWTSPSGKPSPRSLATGSDRPSRRAAIAVAVATVVIVLTALEGVEAFARTTAARTFGSNTFVLAQIASQGQISRTELSRKLQRNRPILRRDTRALDRLMDGRVLIAPTTQSAADIVVGSRRFENASVNGTGAALAADS